MKTKLNILCVLVFAVLLASMVGGFFMARVGFNASSVEASPTSPEDMMPVADVGLVNVMPIADRRTALKVTNEVTGQQVCVWPTQMYVEKTAEQAKAAGNGGLGLLLSVIAVVAGLFSLLAFIRFIVQVNHGAIINKRNVSLLTICGSCLLAYGVLATVVNLYVEWSENQLFRLANYATNPVEGIEFTPLLLGLAALVAAQVLGMVQKMEEEQKLTI